MGGPAPIYEGRAWFEATRLHPPVEAPVKSFPLPVVPPTLAAPSPPKFLAIPDIPALCPQAIEPGVEKGDPPSSYSGTTHSALTSSSTTYVRACQPKSNIDRAVGLTTPSSMRLSCDLQAKGNLHGLSDLSQGCRYY